jgi:hypothetical protein
MIILALLAFVTIAPSCRLLPDMRRQYVFPTRRATGNSGLVAADAAALLDAIDALFVG